LLHLLVISFTKKLFVFESLPPIRVKGKTEPVQAYRLSGPRHGTAREKTSRQGDLDMMVGREREFATLYGSSERLSDGRGGIVGIIGQAGLGKSRLIAELRTRAPREEVYGSFR
jgi:ATP-dependent Clp protease ATP-binding subunit ClpA